jgi:Secretion system C-terminal sorting domain
MTKVKVYRVLTLIILLLLIASMTLAQNKIPASVISSGGEKSSSASFILSSTVGEPFVGKTGNASNQQNIGFWYVYKQSTITDVEKEDETIPTVFKLEQNYPNPFNPSTIIKFAVPERSNVLLKVYDILGGEVITLVNEEMDSGWYKREFNASGYSTGVYIYRMQAGSYTSTKKMILIK